MVVIEPLSEEDVVDQGLVHRHGGPEDCDDARVDICKERGPDRQIIEILVVKLQKAEGGETDDVSPFHFTVLDEFLIYPKLACLSILARAVVQLEAGTH